MKTKENEDIQKSMRTATYERATKETKIFVEVNLDVPENEPLVCEVNTGIGFFDHMLEAFAKHSKINLKVVAIGDLHIDGHHTVEDVGMCLGACVLKCLKIGVENNFPSIERFADATVPLDEALCRAAIDFSGRGSVHIFPEHSFTQANIGSFDTALFPEFFGGFVSEARCTLHLDFIRGRNDHHKCEAAFKAFARACLAAWTLGKRKDVPSTKGSLEGFHAESL